MVTRREQNARDVRRPTHEDDLAEKIRNVSIARDGNKLIIPLDMPLEVAHRAIGVQMEEEEKTINLNFDYELTVPEGALALNRVLNDLYGFVEMMGVPGFFGDTPPEIISVQVSRDRVESIPWGKFGVPGIEGYILTSVAWRNKVPYFKLTSSTPGKYKGEVNRIADAIRQRKDSVYKGTAIRVLFPDIDADDPPSMQDFFPKFIGVNKVHPDEVIFSDKVAELVETTLYTPIRQTQLCRDHNIPLKRGVLLEGPYGVGKTLTATVVANLCEENGWTFIHMMNVKQLDTIYSLARHHQPAVVFCEDLDEVLQDEDGRDETINKILNSLSGIDSEGVEILTIFTTNHVDDITQAMLRPGRLDTVVPVRPPDASAVQRLVRLYAADKLPKTEDLTTVGTLLAGKLASVVREAVERSKLSAVRRLTKGQPLSITAHDIEVAARGMEAHNKLLEPKSADNRSEMELAAVILGDKLLQLGAMKSTTNGAALGWERSGEAPALGASSSAE